jgi:hypothetical protein
MFRPDGVLESGAHLQPGQAQCLTDMRGCPAVSHMQRRAIAAMPEQSWQIGVDEHGKCPWP